MKKPLHFWMASAYLLAAGMPAYQAIRHTGLEVRYLTKAYDIDNLQNNGAIKEAEVWKEIAHQHHFLGPIIKGFFAPSLNKQFQIPPQKKARQALDKIPGLIQLRKDESKTAVLWSMVLLMISLVYFVSAVAARHKDESHHLFALTVIAVVFLAAGVIAPAMVIVVGPATPMFPRFILDYQTRSILGVISELYSSSYWMVAVCLTVFSVLIPLAKAGLTVFVLETRSLSKKLKIAKWLHSISKWSMADVFVAAILLANFAVKSNPSTQADLFLGFYYFLGYCLLSMVTTTLLQNKVQVAGKETEYPRVDSAPTKRVLDK